MALTGTYFNSSYYLTENTDVANKWTGSSALDHYAQFGALEGRAPNSWFNAQYYRANNADLGSMNALQLFDHYEDFGYKEGRITSTTYANFDSAKYLSDYGDLGTNGITAATALSHYFQYGITEGRVAKNTDGSLITTATTGATYTLTTGADALTGDANNNTFVATEATLSSADLLNGGNGTDTLRYASSGSDAVNESGFETLNIEKIQVTSDATGGTTFDVTGSTGLTTLINSNSSTAVTFTGGTSIVAVEMNNVSVGNTTINYDAATIAGATDSMSVSLNGNKTIDGGAIGTLRANGIETFAVSTTGAASLLTEIASAQLKAMTITGAQNLTLANANFFNTAAVNTVDASTFTGALNITASNSGTANIDVKVTGGTGNDRANFSNGWDTSDEFNGGLGTDTLALTQTVVTGLTTATAGTVSNVEILEITTDTGGITDMDNFSGVTTVYYSAGLGAATTVQDTGATQTVQVDLGTVAQNLTTTVKTNSAADTLNLTLSKIGAADLLGTATAANFETINLVVTDDAATVGTGAATVADLVAANTTKLTINSNADLTLSAATTTVLTTLDASASTGKLTLTGVDLATAGGTVTLGSGNDVLTMGTASGADTIDLSKGGADRIVYTTVAQSDTDMDTVKGFVSGSDIIDLRTMAVGAVTTSSQFKGVFATFGQAQGSLSAVGDCAFDQSTGILWVDSATVGTLDSSDFRVKLDGVTSITAADLGLAATTGITFTANKAAFNTATAADSTQGSITASADDTISSTAAFLIGSTINGQLGTDSLTVSNSLGAFTFVTTPTAPGAGAQLTGVESVNLSAGSTGLVNFAAQTGVGFAVTNAGTTQASTVTMGSGANQSFTATGSGANTVVLGAGLGQSATITGLVGTVQTVALGGAGQSVTIGAGTNGITTTAANALGSSFVGSATGLLDTLNLAAGTYTLGTDAAVTGAGALMTGIDFLVGTGVTALTLNPGNALTFTPDATAVTVSNAGSTVTIADAAFTNQTLGLSGAGNFVVTGHDSTGLLSNSATGTVSVTTGAGATTFTTTNAMTIAADASGANTVTLGGAGAYTVTGVAATTDITQAAGETGAVNITMAASTGANTFTSVAGGGAMTVNAALLTAGAVLTIAGAAANNTTTVTLGVGAITGVGGVVHTGTGSLVVNEVAQTAAGSLGTFTGSATGSDTWNLAATGGGIDTIVGAGALSNISLIDTVSNFKATGADIFKTGVNATTLNNLTIATASTTTLAGAISTAAVAAGATLAANTQAYIITVSAGTAAGTYALQNLGADANVTAADFLIQLTGTIGAIVVGDFVV